jgi:cell division inhibitor SepF
MSYVSQAVRSFKSIWNHGDDDYEADEQDSDAETDSTDYSPTYRGDSKGSGGGYGSGSGYSGGSGGPSPRRLQPVRTPLRAREKNIYTLRPTSLDEAAIAADYLKTGSAVILNLETVDRAHSVRIIDFMSGVCYGLDGQGHAMKLGDSIFLFTPNDFEISSDETDYGENTDFFFKDVADNAAAAQNAKAVADTAWPNPAATMPAASSYNMPERRTWER